MPKIPACRRRRPLRLSVTPLASTRVLTGYGTSAQGCVLFFFSSRRRHTRFDCDWSSDVCSSDLGGGGGGGEGFGKAGKVRTDFGGDDVANALAIQRDGGIVVAGRTGPAFAL